MSSHSENSKSRRVEGMGRVLAVAEPAPAAAVPQLADGTRGDINIQSASGLRITTRCETITQFIATFQRYSEDSGIFIPNTRRPVGSVTQFTFELASGKTALTGVGTVIEEYTTAENRFGRAGVIIAFQQLGRASTTVFEQMLAARAAARIKPAVDAAPAPIFARAVTVPSVVEPPAKAPAVATPILAKPTRASTVIGIPVIAKFPGKVPFSVPEVATPPAKKREPAVKASARPGTSNAHVVARAADAIITTPPPRVEVKAPVVVEKPPAADLLLDGVPEVLPETFDDTIRDVIPFALHHALGLATAVETQVAIDDESVVIAEPARDPIPEAASVSPDAAVVVLESSVPQAVTQDEQAELEVPSIAPPSRAAWRWVTAIAAAAMLFAGTAAATVVVGEVPSLSAVKAQELAGTSVSTPSLLATALADVSSDPQVVSQPVRDEPVVEPSPAQPTPAQAKAVAADPAPRIAAQRVAPKAAAKPAVKRAGKQRRPAKAIAKEPQADQAVAENCTGLDCL